MVNRRAFIKSGLVVSSAALLPAVALQVAAADMLRPGLECLIFDKRFQEARDIARLAGQQDIPLAETAGDLMPLWYDHLDLRWKQAPMTLAGVTTLKALFVLETLAADRRMAVVYRVAHARSPEDSHEMSSDTTLVSWIIVPRTGGPFAV